MLLREHPDNVEMLTQGLRMNSPHIFADLIKVFSFKGKRSAPLCNISFFLGAGFSKSWDSRFPTGNELFHFKYDEWDKSSRYLGQYLCTHGYNELDDITPDLFKEIIYQLGMYKKYPEIRPRYIDDGNVKIIEAELRALVYEKFKNTAPVYYFDEEQQKITISHELSEDQRTIISFFSQLMHEGDGSQGVSEGIRTHIITTNYDCIPEAILDCGCASDDSFLLYTYRGITPNKICGLDNPVVVHDNWLVNTLIKINGGLEVFENSLGYEFDYTEKNATDIAFNPPQIMLPSKEQDYTQRYFKALFPKAIRLLQESKILVIIGYSLPEEDALLRFLTKQFAEDRADGDQKLIFYVDLASEHDQKFRISSVFPHSEEHRGLKCIPYSGSFVEWVKAFNEYSDK